MIDATQFENPFGFVTASCDWNRDGVDDLAVTILSWWNYAPSPINPGAVRIYLGCPATAASYGTGWFGTQRTPTLGLLLVGVADASVPLKSGATLLVAAPSTIPITIPATGWSDTDTVPNDPVLCFLDLYLQVVELDAGAVGRLSFTNGLQLRIGFDL